MQKVKLRILIEMFYRDNKLVFELLVENLIKGFNINLVINKKV